MSQQIAPPEQKPDRCATCEHTWHGLPCALRDDTSLPSNMAVYGAQKCPCLGPFADPQQAATT